MTKFFDLAYVYENTASKLRLANLSAAQALAEATGSRLLLAFEFAAAQEPAEGVAIHCGLAAQTEEALGPAGAGESR